ncbi:hypothetical protein J1605_016924 [Eschrichtius robustus]|uniref:Uncharacterized protein n=1 Tax=Eschrichtius robustus TaxID=9764 RepID=A0AB34HZ15_ESCRO|nr:hypothetical protein J1605_016924 [Eschrichtius robustus]
MELLPSLNQKGGEEAKCSGAGSTPAPAPLKEKNRAQEPALQCGPFSDLDRNNITRITKTDFAGLKNLRVLHLEDNQVSVIERGAFQDLKQLERL